MSGGSMDYVHYKIKDAADRVQEELAKLMFRQQKGVGLEDFEPAAFYVKENPDKAYLKSAEALRAEVIKRMEEALECMRRAEVYAHEVEWLTSGDTGYDSFCLNLDEALAEVKKNGGAE